MSSIVIVGPSIPTPGDIACSEWIQEAIADGYIREVFDDNLGELCYELTRKGEALVDSQEE